MDIRAAEISDIIRKQIENYDKKVSVTETGTVEKVNIVSGNAVLTKPASEAVRKWKYAPFTADGKAVKALVPVSLSFKM